MKKIWSFIKDKQELVAYVLLSVLLFCALFSSVFAWISAICTVALGIIWQSETKIIGLMLYVNSFYVLFNCQSIFGVTLDIIIVGCLVLKMLGCYIYQVVKHQQKINFKTLIPISLFLVYVALPFHQCHWQDFFAMLFFFILIYIVFERRKSFDFCYVVRAFVISTIVSCIFAMFRDISPILSENILTSAYSGIIRFQGLSFHPNTLNRFIVIGLCCLFILKYKNKISLVEFLLYFIPLYMFGYLTISRSFVITSAVGMIIFFVFYCFRNKTKSISLISLLLCIVFVIGCLFFDVSKVYTQRILGQTNNSFVFMDMDLNGNEFSISDLQDSFDNKPEEWKQDVLDGNVYFDPGRSGLNEIYLRDWADSPKSIWLGYGISRRLIGQMSSHNLYIQELWKHGIVGYMFYAVILLSLINWKKFKNIKYWLSGLIILIPYFFFSLVEQCLYDYINLMLIIFAFTFVRSTVAPEKEQSQIETKKNIRKNGKEYFDIS